MENEFSEISRYVWVKTCHGDPTTTHYSDAYALMTKAVAEAFQTEAMINAGGWTGPENTPQNAKLVSSICQAIKKDIANISLADIAQRAAERLKGSNEETSTKK